MDEHHYPLKSRLARAAWWLVGLTIVFALLDWGRLLPGETWLQDPVVGLGRALVKLATVFVSASLVWRGRSAAWSERDWRRMAWVFGFIVVADTLFDVAQYFGTLRHDSATQLKLLGVGVGCFGIAQVLLIGRHLGGAGAGGRGKLRASASKLALMGGLLAVSLGVFGVLHYQPSWFGRLLQVYLVVLGVSVWAAFAAIWTGALPRPNAVRAFAGLALFLACDLTVIGGMFLSGNPQVMVTSLTWLYYVPALYCLARSVYREDAGAT